MATWEGHGAVVKQLLGHNANADLQNHVNTRPTSIQAMSSNRFAVTNVSAWMDGIDDGILC